MCVPFAAMSVGSGRRTRVIVALAISSSALMITLSFLGGPAAATNPPTTTIAAVSPSTARPATTIAAQTTVATTVVPTTFPGPPPRGSHRVASPVDIEKIRATSLPLRMMGITLAAAIAALAAIGFVYGRIRSRIPSIKVPKAPKAPKVAVAGAWPVAASAPGGRPMPPTAIALPPPTVEDAVADTVIFEPPPTHLSPPVITAPPVARPASFAPPVPAPPSPAPPSARPVDSEPVDSEPVEDETVGHEPEDVGADIEEADPAVDAGRNGDSAETSEAAAAPDEPETTEASNSE